MADATIQRRRITPAQISTLFWIGSGIGFAVALVIALCSGLIATVYHDPRLGPLALCSSLTFALSGLSGQHVALLRRAFQFAEVTKVQLLAGAASLLLAVALALSGAGYWALVARTIANSGLVTLGVWLACPWRPGWPKFDAEVKSMIGFGLHIVGFSIAYSVSRAVDRIGLGLFYSPRVVGYYQNAWALYDSSIFSALGQLHNVGTAALSRLQSDSAALSEKYESALSMTAFFMMPAAVILSLTAQDLVVVALGKKWQPAGALLAILALRGIFQTVEGSQGWLHLSLGRADRWKNWGVVSTIVQVVAVAGGMPFGATGVAAAITLASAMIAVPSISYAGRPAGIGSRLVIRAVGPQFVGAAACIIAGWIVRETMLQHLPAVQRIMASVVLCAMVYLPIVVGFFRLRAPIRVIAGLLRHRCAPYTPGT
jgi:PST family polysaccharide transporter